MSDTFTYQLMKDEFDEIFHSTIEFFCEQHAKTIMRIDESVACVIESYDWSAHYDELKDVLEFAVLSARDGVIRLQNLPIWLLKSHMDKMVDPVCASLGSIGSSFFG